MIKFFEVLEQALPTLKEILPNKMLWSMILFHYGLQVIIVLIYIIDWLLNSGQRTELLELLEKL